MKRLGMLAILSIFFLMVIFSLSFAQPKPGAQPKTPVPVAPGIPPSPGVTVPHDPLIREFTGSTYPVVQGTEVTLRWRVEPGPGGDPIVRVNIVASYLPEEPLPAMGERRFIFLGGDSSGNRTYRLTATNSVGRSVSQTLTIRQVLIRDALDQLEISLATNPPEFRAGRPVDFEIRLSNREGGPILGMNITVTQGGRTVGSLRDVRIGHGTVSVTHRLPDTGFTAAPGEYTVDVEYRGVHRVKRFRAVPAPYFVIAPAP